MDVVCEEFSLIREFRTRKNILFVWLFAYQDYDIDAVSV